jgi:hypothetical protein
MLLSLVRSCVVGGGRPSNEAVAERLSWFKAMVGKWRQLFAP